MSSSSDHELDLLLNLIDDDHHDNDTAAAPPVTATKEVVLPSPQPAPGKISAIGTTCPYSNLRLRHQLASADSIQMKLRKMNVVKVAHLRRSLLGPGRTAGENWAVFGVVSTRDIKTASKSGSKFLSMLMTDLCQNTFRLLVFDTAFNTLNSNAEIIGSVLCIGNGKVLPDRSESSTGPITISIDDPDQVVVMGPSLDFAHCKGRKKDGTRCTIGVDQRRAGGYCTYHVQTAYRTMSAGRMDLQHGAARSSLSRETPNSAMAIRSRSLSLTSSQTPTSKLQKTSKRARLTTLDPQRESSAKDVAVACLSRSVSYRTPKINYVGGRPVYVKQKPIIVPILSKSNPGISSSALIDLDEDASDPSIKRAAQRLAARSQLASKTM